MAVLDLLASCPARLQAIGRRVMDDPALTGDDWDTFQTIMENDEDIDLVPATYNGVEVAQIVKWTRDIDGGNPTYTVLAILARPDVLEAVRQPEISPLSA